MTELYNFLFVVLGCVIGIFLMALMQAKRLSKHECKWHATAYRKPTEEDADVLGNIWATDRDWVNCAHQIAWQRVALMPERFPFWCKTPGLPPGGDDHAGH